MADADKRSGIEHSLAGVANEVLEYARSQVDLWRQVPAAALMTGVAGSIGWGPDPDDYPLTRGYAVVGTTPSGYIELFVDLSSGAIVQADFVTPPRVDQLVRAAMNPNRLDAANVLAEYQRTRDYRLNTRGNGSLVYGMDDSDPQREVWQRFADAYSSVVGPPYVRTSRPARAIQPIFKWAVRDEVSGHVWRILPDPKTDGGWCVYLHQDAPEAGLAKSLRSAVRGHTPVRFIAAEMRDVELRTGLQTRGHRVDRLGL